MLLANDLHPAAGTAEFIELILGKFPDSTYWLTTHCQGDATVPIQHIGHLFDDTTESYMKMIKSTSWEMAKTRAIDFTQPSLWFDDDCFYEEAQTFRAHNVTDNLVVVNLAKNPNQLLDFVKSFPLPKEMVSK